MLGNVRMLLGMLEGKGRYNLRVSSCDYRIRPGFGFVYFKTRRREFAGFLNRVLEPGSLIVSGSKGWMFMTVRTDLRNRV